MQIRTWERFDDAAAGYRTLAISDNAFHSRLFKSDQGYDEFIVFDGSLGSSAEERRNAYRRFRCDIASQF